MSEFVTSGSFWIGAEGSLRDLTWVTGTWKTIDNCIAIEMYTIRDVRALGQDLQYRAIIGVETVEELGDPVGIESCRLGLEEISTVRVSQNENVKAGLG